MQEYGGGGRRSEECLLVLQLFEKNQNSKIRKQEKKVSFFCVSFFLSIFLSFHSLARERLYQRECVFERRLLETLSFVFCRLLPVQQEGSRLIKSRSYLGKIYRKASSPHGNHARSSRRGQECSSSSRRTVLLDDRMAAQRAETQNCTFPRTSRSI